MAWPCSGPSCWAWPCSAPPCCNPGSHPSARPWLSLWVAPPFLRASITHRAVAPPFSQMEHRTKCSGKPRCTMAHARSDTLVRRLAWPCSAPPCWVSPCLAPPCCNPGSHPSARPWDAPLYRKGASHRSVTLHAMASAMQDGPCKIGYLGAAVGTAVLGTAVLGIAVLGVGVLQPGTAPSAHPLL